MQTPPDNAAKARRHLLRLGLLALLVATAAAGLLIDPQVLFDEVHQRRFAMLGWVRHNYVLAVALYVGIYLACVTLSLPGAVWLTIIGGFFFGTLAATIYTVLAATAGAIAVFLAAKFILGDALKRRAGAFLGVLEQGFRRHAFNYLIVLRMLPLFPFWVVNLVPALVGMRLRTYAIATFVGIIPGSIVFASLGAGLAEVIGQPRLDADMLSDPHILLPLVGLAALALAPVIYTHLKAKRSADA